MSETDPAVIGIERCGCVTYANSAPDRMERSDDKALAQIIRAGGSVVRTTVGEARAMPNFLPSKCPHDPKGWGREQPREKQPHDRLRYQRNAGRNLSIVSVVIEPHTVAGNSSWPKGIRGGEVGKRDGQWYATPGWLDERKTEARDGHHPSGPAELLGPFPSQRAAALALIPHAEARAAEIASNRHPSQRSNDAPSTNADPALIRTQHNPEEG